jgi:DNA-directed RNA polymerase specialized sigma24 family protein
MLAVVTEPRPPAMARAVQGDADSFSQLIQPLLDPAYRLAAVMLSDRSAAEDAVQEASVKAWRKLRQLRGDVSSLRPWFLSIVANECRMARRKRWWSVIRMADVLEEVARALNVSPAGAKSRIYRAAHRLRADLTLEEVT